MPAVLIPEWEVRKPILERTRETLSANESLRCVSMDHDHD
jgi:hypothetical protein